MAQQTSLEEAVRALRLGFDKPVEGEDVYIIHGFAQHFGLSRKLMMLLCWFQR